MKKWIWICLLVALVAVVWHRRVNSDATPDSADRAVTSTVAENREDGAEAKPMAAVIAGGQERADQSEETDESAQALLSIDRDPAFPHRLQNNGLPVSQMFRRDSSILLRNAMIDSTSPIEQLAIPEHLKSGADPLAYIVQSVGTIDEDFRRVLRGAGAEIVSYVPNNAYLVTASANAISQVKRSPRVLAAIPYEPYYKLSTQLLPTAIKQEKLQQGAVLRLGLFPGTRDAALEKIEEMGGRVLKESEFPFGSVMDVYPGAADLVALAQLTEVQLLEPYATAVALNDLSRPRIGIASNVTDTVNLHGLTGSGVVVGVPGSGVDGSHPDLTNRVIVDTNFNTPRIDATGHETHVAGIIAGAGTSLPASFTNGSTGGSSFAGKAPESQIYPLAIFPATGDAFVGSTNGATGAVVRVDVTYESAGYQIPPSVFIFDSTPVTRITNVVGGVTNLVQTTPGQNAFYEAVLTDSKVSAIVPQVTVWEFYNISNGFLVTNYQTNIWTGSNYTETNLTVVVTPPWSDFQVITNQAQHTNIYVVNNSWGQSLQEYNILSTMYDAATRDSMPHWQGDQEVNYVFSAGNSGFGTTSGQGGVGDSVVSPATAKNVITVGAIENERSIPASTNFPFAFQESDSDSQVADFSSRGNVGIGLEGDFGRFKPDIVAPGTWVLSLASSTFPATNRTVVDQSLGNDRLRYESGTSMAAPAVSGMLALMQEFFTLNHATTNSPALNKALLINGARPASPDYDYAVKSQINYQGWGVPQLSNTIPADFKFLTNNLGLEKAQVVAVEQSAFGTNRLRTGQLNTYRVTLEDGAQDFALRVSLAWTDPPGNPVSSLQLVNDLDLVVSNENNGEIYIGNNITSGNDFNDIGEPNAADDSVVVEYDFVNNIENIFIPGPFTNNGAPVNLTIWVKGRRVNVNAVADGTNAVEQDYALVVSTGPGQQVTLDHQGNLDINSFTNRTATYLLNGIPRKEEVVGANHPFLFNGDGTNNAYGSTNQWNFYVFTNTSVAPMTNVSTNITGSTTNSSTNVVSPLTNVGPNVAFITFFPPNAGRARNDEADIDLYVTRSGKAPPQGAPNLTNLAPGILWETNTMRSTNRGGIEVISFDDAAIGEVFYVGVKSEDQQGGRYGFLAISRSDAFAQTNADGTIGIPFFPAPVEIPDGSPAAPGGVQLFGISTYSTNIMSPFITNVISHENFGDLTVSLTHDDKTVYLWNHNNNFPGGIYSTQTRYFDADAYGVSSTNRIADGPGEMLDFFNDDAIGLWIMTVTDDALNHTGSVLEAGLRIGDTQNRMRTNNGNVIDIGFEIDPGESFIDFVYVPFTVTNMQVSVIGAPNSDPGIDLLVAYDQVPAAPFFTNAYFTNVNGTNYAVTNVSNNTNIFKLLAPDTSSQKITIDHNSSPRPLTFGFWFARVVNNTSTKHTLTLRFELEHNLAIGGFFGYESQLDHDLVDNASTNFLISVPDYRTIVNVEVGVGIEHPRPSDLVLHLFSPSGKKVLLFENRGDTARSNLFANFSEDTNLNTAVITDSAVGTMHHYTNLVEIKWITNQFTNIISPPRLLTSNVVGVADHVQPEGIDIPGNTVYVVGSYRTNAAGTQTNWGMALNYPLPFTNNSMPTNWLTIWPDENLPSGNQSDVVVFKDLVATTQGVFMVGVTNKDYFPVTPGGVGFTNEHRIDVDTGCTNGTFSFQLDTYFLRDHFHVYYQGNVIPAVSVDWPGTGNGTGTSYTTPFSGTNSFVRLVVNQGGNTNPGTAWALNSISYTCAAASPAKNQSVVVGYDPNGPVPSPFDLAEGGATMISRAVTNNPYGVAGVDRLFGIAKQFETGFEGEGSENTTNVTQIARGTNYLYVTGSAQFDLTNSQEKFFISKVTDEGLPLWTATEQAGGGATVISSGGAISSFDVFCAGTNYSTAPAVTIVDLHSQGFGATATAAINPTTGHITGITVGSPGTGYQRPVVYIEKPALASNFGSAGLDVDVLGGTNIFAVGYSNTVASGASSQPTIWAYDEEGCLLWVRSTNLFDGKFEAVQVSRTNLYAVGRHLPGSGNSSSMLQRWDRFGNLLASTNYTHLSDVAGSPKDTFDDLLVMQNPDRVYAIGTRTNTDATTDGILVEIDPETLATISVSVLDKGSGNERGKGVATDGKDLYALVETSPGGVQTTEIYHYRVRNYYYSEESLEEFEAEPSWFVSGNITNQDWTLRVWDTRVGGTNATPPKIRYWNLNLTYAAFGIPSVFVDTTTGFTGTLLSTAASYYKFEVLPGQSSVTMNINSPGSISAAVSSNGLPSFENSSETLFQNSGGGSFVLTNSNGGNLRVGTYYIAVRNGLETINNDFRISFQGNGDLPPVTVVPLLANGVITNGTVSAGPGFSFYTFEVPAAATGARFELSSASPNVNLFLRKDDGSGSPPSVSAFDYRSVHTNSGNETIFLVPDSGSAKALTAGTWYLGVQNVAQNPANFSVRASSLTGIPYVITTVASGQTVSGNTVVGNAPTHVYKLPVTDPKQGVVFEVTGLTGSGDLIVRKGVPPLISVNAANTIGLNSGREVAIVRTNAGDLTLVGDWYFGVVNNEETNISYSAVATIPSGNLLTGSAPLQLSSIPSASDLAGGDTFGFGLEVVPGERYQVQYSSTPTGPWHILTNIVAPQNAVIEFVHANALTNHNRLMYRVQQVP